ncbi:Exonuclease 1 [Phytophthora nicotianae]|uniref:Exonuclease 1 n=1 Tax=Phytophthora nicotianae TaxID=4792 RepID=A0A0W8C480_PHYNI|nr:Exonuclease 1 [Phytophthora nicotianae]
MDRITALLHNGVTPYVVFDGGPLPMKKGTEEERRKSRQKNRELGIQHYNNKRFGEARKCFIRAADVSPYMAHRVIQHLKAHNVAYVVAPYEADAQLAYLVKNRLADGVITEDSDCLPFGCQTVLFKMDRDNVAQEIQTANLKKNKGMSFHMFTEQMIIRALRLEGKVRVPATYEEDFRKAVLTFRHQRVYCPTKKELVPLTPIPADLLETDPAMDFVGPMLPSDAAKAIADGYMDPITMMPFPAKALLPPRNSIQPNTTKSMQPSRKVAPTPKPKVAITSFFHASESAAAAVFNAPRTKPTPTKRKLPPSFMDKWASNAASPDEKNTQSEASDSAPKPATKSPLVTSRFFGINPKKMSPPDECVKKSAPRTLDSSTTFQSQEPRGFDVARNISFDPLSDKVRVLPTVGDNGILKENQAPNSQETIPSPQIPTKETAFSRMMRAGSMLQQHRLKKRKSIGPGFRSGKPRIPLSSRIEHLAFSRNRKADEPTRIPSTLSNSQLESTDASEHIDDPDDPPESLKAEDDIDTKATMSTIDEQPAGIETIVRSSKETTVAAPIASFDRFRFQH